MQLSASTLPYDPPSASAADPALAADRATRTSSSDTPADGFGAMLVAKSNAPSAPAKSGASAKTSASPLGATAADADETDPSRETGPTPADPAATAAGEGIPDAAALANWLAANAVLTPVVAAPVVEPAGLDLAPAAPDAAGGVEDSVTADADSVCAAGVADPARFTAIAGLGNQTFSLPATAVASGESAGLPAAPATIEAADGSVPASTDNPAAPGALVRFGRLLTQTPAADANAATAAATTAVAAATDGAGLAPTVLQDAVGVAQDPAPALPATGKTKPQPAASATTETADTADTEASIAPGELPADVTEKFAALQERFLRRYSIGEKGELKKSIAAVREMVVGPSSALGINAAQPVPAMPALTLTPSSDAAERISAVPPPLTFDALVKDAATLPTTGVSHAASRAVDSVMAIADHFGTGGQRAVSLQFSVSGVELAVHVELRGNAVHTTFRTDSPELRAALAAEWQAVNPTASGNRSQWLADPVFSSSSSGNSTSGNAGSGFQQHADARQGQPQGFADDLARLRSPLRAAAATTTAPVAAAPTRPVVITSTRLHAFA